jgi:putative transposase
MPAKNSRKTYLKNGYYHIYNRGVEKRIIFLDQQDYGVFLSYLKEYLLPKDEKELYERLSDSNITSRERDKILKSLRLNNFNQELSLIAYCLMPNHFHFFIKQRNPNAIDSFMQSLCTRYSIYFNKKHKRVGHLYQGVYKAALVTSDTQFVYLSKYIHKQAVPNQPSSYPEYLGTRKTLWINPKEALSSFSKSAPSLTYKNFVTENDSFANLENLTLEEDV